MSAPLLTIRVERAFGPVVEGEAVVSAEGFSPRYDLDRWTGLITKPGHRLEGTSIKDKVCFFPTAKGGVAAGWAFHDIKAKGISPMAYVFGVTNPVMVRSESIFPVALPSSSSSWTPSIISQISGATALRAGTSNFTGTPPVSARSAKI